jgi:hypothetical protein
VRGEWSPEELVESWALLGDDWRRVGNKSGATRLGFAVVLKFFELQARFPRAACDGPPGGWRAWPSRSACRRLVSRTTGRPRGR